QRRSARCHLERAVSVIAQTITTSAARNTRSLDARARDTRQPRVHVRAYAEAPRRKGMREQAARTIEEAAAHATFCGSRPFQPREARHRKTWRTGGLFRGLCPSRQESALREIVRAARSPTPPDTEVLQSPHLPAAIVASKSEEQTMDSATLKYGRKYQRGLNGITTIAMTGFHAGALAAFFFIDGGAVLSALILYCVAGMLGIGMGYHRLLTHRGYKTYKC